MEARRNFQLGNGTAICHKLWGQSVYMVIFLKGISFHPGGDSLEGDERRETENRVFVSLF